MSGEERRLAHEEFDELAVGWALGALEPDDETRFLRHVDGCERCRQTVDDAVDVSAALAFALPPEEPSEDLRERILAAVAVEPRGATSEPRAIKRSAPVGNRPTARALTGHRAHRRPPTSPPPRPARHRIRAMGLGVRGLALAAGLVLLAGLGVWNVMLRSQQEATEASLAAQASVIAAMDDRGTYVVAPLRNDDGNRVGSVVLHDGTAQIMSDGLPLNDTAAETFVLWGLAGDGDPAPLGTFDVVTRTIDVRGVTTTATDFSGYDGFAVSLEPGRTAPAAPTAVVASGTVGS